MTGTPFNLTGVFDSTTEGVQVVEKGIVDGLETIYICSKQGYRTEHARITNSYAPKGWELGREQLQRLDGDDWLVRRVYRQPVEE